VLFETLYTRLKKCNQVINILSSTLYKIASTIAIQFILLCPITYYLENFRFDEISFTKQRSRLQRKENATNKVPGMDFEYNT
jgi:hypothetical protein